MGKIEIEIGTDGKVSLDAQGFHGPACSRLLDMLIRGLKKLSDRKKPEYAQTKTRVRQ